MADFENLGRDLDAWIGLCVEALCAVVGIGGGIMNGGDRPAEVVTAKLPSGVPIRVELAGPGTGDGLTSVGLRDLDLGTALDTVGEIGSLVVEKLKAARPTRTTVELHFGFEVEAGKLTALWVGGKGKASLTVTLEWSGHAGGSAGGGDG